MPKTKEPQSYGSGPGWVEGKTGGKVNDPKGLPPSEHQEFYDDARESEESGPHQGGSASPLQLAESSEAGGRARLDSLDAVSKVTSQESGAKRDSYFRKRDYE